MHDVCSCPGNARLFQYRKCLVLVLEITQLFFICFSILLENFSKLFLVQNQDLLMYNYVFFDQ